MMTKTKCTDNFVNKNKANVTKETSGHVWCCCTVQYFLTLPLIYRMTEYTMLNNYDSIYIKWQI